MANARREFRHGRIVGAFLNTKSKGKQLHPAVVLTPDSMIVQPGDFDPRTGAQNSVVVIGVTTKYALYNEQYLKLPFHADGHQVTKLNKDCAAIIGWYDRLEIPDDVRFFAGDVPPTTLSTLNDMVRADLVKRFSREFADMSDALSLLFEG